MMRDEAAAGAGGEALSITVVPAPLLHPAEAAELLAFLSTAFGIDFAPHLASLVDPVHVLGRLRGELVSHALWIPRILEHETAGPLHTAYVEAVATAPAHRGRGYATAVMKRIAEEIRDRPAFELAALSTGVPEFYARLGWRLWRGPRGVRRPGGVELTPDEPVMVLPLPHAPPVAEDVLLTVDYRSPEPW
jgi:aminoglycoside 2'-N-acetyltransferase I